MLDALPRAGRTNAPDLANLEQQGMRDRLDLSAARFETQSIEYALTLRRRGMLPELNVGVTARNDRRGTLPMVLRAQ